MSLVRINWRPDASALRKFGMTMLIGFGVIGLIFQFYYHKPVTAMACCAFGGFAGALGLTGTKLALPLYLTWMAVGFVMGNIISRLVLMIVFYGLITPMGLCMRLIGRDRLALKRDVQKKSYWRNLDDTADARNYERQF